jgi:hypothetical protein
MSAGHGFKRCTADTLVKTGAGRVHTVSVGATTATPTAGLLSIYDSTTEAGTVIFSSWVFATDPGHSIILDAEFQTGLYVSYDGALANFTVTVTYD